MAKVEFYCQCMLRKNNLSTVGFIPLYAASVGNVVGIERASGLDRGWRVESVGTPVAKDRMRLYERQFTRQRGASDLGTKTKRVCRGLG